MFRDEYIKWTMNWFWKPGTIRSLTARKHKITGGVEVLITTEAGFKSTREYDYHFWGEVMKEKRHEFQPTNKKR